MKWYALKKVERCEFDAICAEIHVPPESPWFSGHFPGKPILPGVAQLEMVFDIIEQACLRKMKIAGVRRVRFKQVIKPGDALIITATPLQREVQSYSFRIMVGDELVSSGVMRVENRPENMS